MTNFIEIDGGHLEGGGQVVRTSIALSAITSRPVKIINIRAKRCKPGLAPQHLKAILACAEMCDAQVSGAEIGSKEVSFIPGKLKSGNFIIDTKTAGSVVLILQTVLIPALHSPSSVKFEIIGGTEGLWAPSIDYFNEIVLRFLEKMGIRVTSKIVKHGFYPKGEGKVIINITPCQNIKPIKLVKQGKLTRIDIRSGASENLKNAKVAERIIEGAKKIFPKFDCEAPVYLNTASVGAYSHIHAHYENTILGSTVIGEKKISSEQLGKKCAEILKQDMDTGACLDRYMADQILPFMALSGSGSVSVAEITPHTLTNIHVIEKFLPVKFTIDKENNIISVKSL